MDRSLQGLNFNWIRSFEAAARHLSFTEAARELHMTQAGVSHQIRNLENHLDERLFHRLPRSLQLVGPWNDTARLLAIAAAVEPQISGGPGSVGGGTG